MSEIHFTEPVTSDTSWNAVTHVLSVPEVTRNTQFNFMFILVVSRFLKLKTLTTVAGTDSGICSCRTTLAMG